jgi:tetratricopeptide (TPR) repeat protein/CHAT domain-containing protein
MALELNLRFPDPGQVVIQLEEEESGAISFASPLGAAALKDIRWYLEVYSAQYTADVDDQRAETIEASLKTWGEALFDAVFGTRAAQRLFNAFQDALQDTFQNTFQNRGEAGRLITISARHPAILGLPWELLRDPAGTYLLHETPRISVRRRLAGAGGGRRAYRFQPQGQARILFVISRPNDAGFIDPRSEAQAVLRAIAAEAAGRVEAEFLCPATLDALMQRLEDTTQPRVDILHFDGHGVYDADGHLWEMAKRSDAQLLTKGSRQEAQDIGYLLFEDAEGKAALISAETLGDMLHRQQIGLVVLSACQSAAVGQGAETDDPATAADAPGVLGSVAARLTHGGLPAVLAMTHSVLVTATEALFGQFYQYLGRGQGMGEALDNARRYLYRHPERGTRLRGQQQEITLRLQDWFLPALYQAGADTPLLTNAPNTGTGRGAPPCAPGERDNLPDLQEAGFWGRSRELWQIERAFGQGTRRLSITGFGGQGKTYLAVEAGRWLHQTGMFERVCFVDYAAYQGQDPVAYAVSTLATVLNASLIDAEAVTAYLQAGGDEGQTTVCPYGVLIILDNLEALEVGPQRQLLDAAKPWSEAGHSRVLLTTRQPNFGHPAYKTEGSRQHIALPLRGLGSAAYPNDALDYFAALRALPPAPTTPKPDRAALVKLFAMVDFHPLSMGLLAWQMKDRRIAEVGGRLAQLLLETPVRAGETPNPLVASLNLSLDRLDDQARQWLPRLGVFQGGAMEDNLLAITEIMEADWQPIRAQLEQMGLIQVEYLLNINPPYLRFHPTLAPVLWPQLSLETQVALQTHYRQRYCQLSHWLYFEDNKNPYEVRAIARHELSNLSQSVNQAIAAGDVDAVDFGDKVNKFFHDFGLSQDRGALVKKLKNLAGLVGSSSWFTAYSNQGDVLMDNGRTRESLAVFTKVLQGLGKASTYERCVTLGRIGRCLEAQGQAIRAAEFYRAGLVVADLLEQNAMLMRQQGIMLTGLGNVLAATGDYSCARAAYEKALGIGQLQGDIQQIGVVKGQLGNLAIAQGDLKEADIQYQKALKTFHKLGQPATEAIWWHQLGIVHHKAQRWDEAEQHYREAARLHEEQGNLAMAAQTWSQLGMVNQDAGRIEVAIAWYDKAILEAKAISDMVNLAKTLSNLANLLQTQHNPSTADV